MKDSIGMDSAATRIRDNQRRSRARRKEYIHDLEQRLRKFHLEKLHVTVEVQKAARKVAQENQLLRALLAECGVFENEIDRRIQSHHAENNASRSDLATGPGSEPCASTTTAKTLKGAHAETEAHSKICDEKVAKPAVSLVECSSAEEDMTSCEQAASIIASMRGHDNPEEVRAELCSDDTITCRISNSRLLEIMGA